VSRSTAPTPRPIKKILVANRSEIAIRVFRAANELGLKTVAIWAKEDKLALHRFKADEAYAIGSGPHLPEAMGPIESYLSIDEVLRVAKLSGADAIHPGYGLLSESPEFVDACNEAGITFIGPRAETMRRLGNKVAARNLAIEIGVPVLFERDCSVQRRNQKVVERAPAPYLSEEQRKELSDYALKIGQTTNYIGAGTIEFLMDIDTGAFYFIEVNPRVQVEHTVTEEVTGIDIIKAQIHLVEGAVIGTPESGVPPQQDIRLSGHAIQCRITTEDPEHNFVPDYGRITAYRGATGFGIRLDGGTAYSGAVISRFYDPLLEKVTAWAPTPEEAIRRMDRALREFRIRGVATNLTFLENIIGHPDFQDNSYTTQFIDTTPALFEQVQRQDRATRLLQYIAVRQGST